MRGETLGVGETSESEAGSIHALTQSTNFRRGAWALADQGLFSATSFAVTVLLARWLPVAEFGAYTVGLTLFLLAAAIHNAIVVEPLLVFAPGRFAQSPHAFRRWILLLHWRFSIGAGSLLASIGLVFRIVGHRDVGRALLTFGLGCPFLLLYWLARREPYSTGAVYRSARAGLAYLLVALSTTAALKSRGWLGIETVVACLAAASLLVSLPLVRSWFTIRTSAVPEPGAFARAWRDYAPWSAPAAILGFVPAHVYFLVLPLFAGLHETANLKAAINVVSPIMQATAVLSVMLLPSFVRAIPAGRNRTEVGRAARRLVAGAVLLGMAELLLAAWLVPALYGQRYRGAVPLTMLLTALPAMSAAVNVFAAGLRAAERPRDVLVPYLAASIATVLVGVPLIKIWGARGAAIAMPLVGAMSAFMMWRRWHALPLRPGQGGSAAS